METLWKNMSIKFILIITATICIVSCHTIGRNNSTGTSEAVNTADTTFVYRAQTVIISQTGACVAFSQVMLLSDREICSIHPRANPNKLRHRRALCDINHELYIVDSKYKVSMFEFARLLKIIGVIDGLEWVEIHPRNRLTKYCSNYLIFNR